MSQFANIPAELKKLPQWVNWWKNEEGKKPPLDPKTGKAASHSDPSTWSDFETAIAKSPQVGFVFTENDPYSFIDLDDKPGNPASEEERQKQDQIFDFVDSYAEITPSGNGVHIIVKGKIPHGINKNNIEIYSDTRYATFTGNTVKAEPIRDYNEMINELFHALGGKTRKVVKELEWNEPLYTNRQIYDFAAKAKNKEKFLALWNGNWREYFPDPEGTRGQNPADYALLSMLCYYSNSNQQVIELFRMSGLGQRKKAKRDDYLHRSLQKIRSEQIKFDSLIDFDNLKSPNTKNEVEMDLDFNLLASNAKKESQPQKEAEIRIQEQHTTSSSSEDTKSEYFEKYKEKEIFTTFPPGLVGEMAKYIYESSAAPLKQISICSAIGLMAGICGRTYNYSNTGLNQYIMVVAGTGRGKDETRKGPARLLNAVRNQSPILADGIMGPGSFASGQGLHRALSKNNCFVSVMGEFGKTLSEITSKKASLASQNFVKQLLSLYNSSGYGDFHGDSAYAQDDNSVKQIASPALTILCEGSNASFYDAISPDNVNDGLIPRFIVVSYNGKQVPLNPNMGFEPPFEITKKLVNLIQCCVTITASRGVIQVEASEKIKKKLYDFDIEMKKVTEKSNSETIENIYTRAGLKAFRLAALLAIGFNHEKPVITEECVEWATKFISKETNDFANMFNLGEVGIGEDRQERDLKRAMIHYSNMKVDARLKYGITESLAKTKNAFPRSFLSRRISRCKSFREHRLGANKALDICLANMESNGQVILLSKEEAWEQYKSRQKVYVIGESFE